MAYRRRAAVLVAACFFMEMLDATIVVTAIPKIGANLSVSPASVGLVVTAFLVTVAVCIPFSAWMTARFGARRVFLSAICVFTVASAGCAVSTSLGMLVGFRVLQGVGGAMMVPVGRIVVFAKAEKSEIVTLMSYIVWPGLVAPVVAPLVGGLITTHAGWRWIFLINVPLGIAALAAALRLIRDEVPPRDLPLDRAGVLLCGAGLGGLTYAAHLISVDHPGWLGVALAGAGSAMTLTLAVRHLERAPAPLVGLRTLRIPTFSISIAGLALSWLVLGAMPFLLPILFQTQFGWSPVRSGAVVLFLFLGNVAIKPATTPLYQRYGFRPPLLVATAGTAATTLVLTLIDTATPIAVTACLLVLSGIARSVALTGYNTLMLADVGEPDVPDAMTLSSVVQQLFAGLGVVAATLALRLGDALDGDGDPLVAYRIAFVVLAALATLAWLNVLRLTRRAGASLLPA